MRYYKNDAGGVLAFSDIQKPDPSLTMITEAEATAILNPPPTLEEAQGRALARVNAAFESAAAARTAGYPDSERLTWPTQQKEALAWDADNTSPTPFLDGVAQARGIDVADMRSKTLENTKLFLAASQQAIGLRQRLRDLIDAAKTPEELEAIQWPT